MQPPNKRDFVNRHRDELCGLCAQGLTANTNAVPVVTWMRAMFEKIDRKLEAMFDELAPAEPIGTTQLRPAAGTGRPAHPQQRTA